jgi:hypothetical protein
VNPRVTSFVIVVTVGIFCLRSSQIAFAQNADAPTPVVLTNPKIRGSLDLDNNVPIRWKKPDGSGYISIFALDEKGTVRLCNDPYFFESSDIDHLVTKVIEVRNPASTFPDFRLPISRTSNIYADSKLVLRSLSLVEPHDPSEINLIRTGNDNPNDKDDFAPVGNGAVVGLIRWMGRRTRGKTVYDGYISDAELIARNYGTSEKDHYGAVIFQVMDSRYGRKGDTGTMVIMKRGVRIGELLGSPGDGVVGSMFEVDSSDDRPVIFRRSQASTTQPVMLAMAVGKDGSEADEQNTLAMVKAQRVSSNEGVLSSRVEIQTNKGNRLESDWVLPVPAAEVSLAGAQGVPSGEPTVLTFEREQHDADGIFEEQAKTRLTCRTRGRYAISACVEFAANGKGSRQVLVRRNGRDEVAAMRVPAVADETTQITFTSPPVELKPGDYVELLVRQTSGQALAVPTTGQLAPKFSMTRVG